jgi:DNA-binding CsgD family transcriptional regulator
VLYGRQEERAALDVLLGDARDGRSGALVIRGEPGIGKTALLEYAAEAADGMRVLRAAGVESESELPYAALHQLLRPVAADVDRLPEPQREALGAALGTVAGRPDRFAVSVALLNLLAEAAEEQPLLCLVDDAQWLDQESADALLFAGRRMQAEAIAMVFTAREGVARPFEAQGVGDLVLAGLDVTASGALLDARTDGELPTLVRQRLIATTAGNPLALIELPGQLSQEQLAGRTLAGEPLPLTDTLERSFLDRKRALSTDAQRLLLLAAAEEVGSEDTVLGAARLAGIDDRAAATVEESGLLRFRDRRVEFRHPLVRSAIYQRANVEERHAAHAGLADVLTADADDDRRAWHRALATVGPDEEVAAALESSAHRAKARSGHAAAARALARSAELTPDTIPRVRRMIGGAESAWLAGQIEDAMHTLDDATQLGADPVQLSEINRMRGLVQLRQGNPSQGYDLLLSAAEHHWDPLWVLMLAAEASSYSGRMDRMIEIGERAEHLTPRNDGDRFVRFMLLGVAASLKQEFEAAFAYLDQALDAGRELTGPHELVAMGTCAFYRGDTPTALAFYDRAETSARRNGAVAHLPFVLEMRSLALQMNDRYSEALVAASEGLELGRETKQLSAIANHLAGLAMIAAKQGREQECMAFAGECLDLTLPRGVVLPAVTARWAVGVLHLGLGRPEEALRALDEAVLTPGAFHNVIHQRSAPDRFDAAIHCGRRDAAEEAVAAFGHWQVAPWGEAILERFAAMLAEGDEAEQHFVRAIELGGLAPRRFEDARTRLRFGEFLRRERRRTDAREHLRSAVETFERLGLETWAERGRAELRATGETARKRDPSTLDDLTPQELQIAKLVAQEGLSNPQIAARLFLSRRTIEYHLRKVYSKLGIASRAELATVELG